MLRVARPASASPHEREVIELDDGSRVEGKLVDYVDQDHVTIELDSGERRRLDWIHIQSMKDAAPPARVGVVTLKDGTVLRGDIVDSAVGDHVRIRLSGGEIRRVMWDDVAGVVLGETTPPAASSSSVENTPTDGIGQQALIDGLRIAGRMALTGFGGYELGSANHTGFGGSLQYYLSDSLGVGVSARWFGDRASDLSSPTQDTSWMTDMEFIYTGLPLLYVLGGVGFVSTKPVALIDPSRAFDDKLVIAPVIGVGARIFFGRAIALSLEMRDVIFAAPTENPSIAADHTDPSTWLGSPSVVNDIELGFGLTLWLPTQ